MTTTTSIIQNATAQDNPRTLLSEELERYARTHVDGVKRLAKLLSDQPGTTSTNRRFVPQRAIREAIDGTRELVPNVLPYSDLPWIAICLETDVDPNDLPEPRKPRPRRKGLSVEAYREQQRQRKGKLGGRVELTPQEKREVAELNAAGLLHKTTAAALTVYTEPGYEIRHGVMDKSSYFVMWAREGGRTDRSYLGKFSSDEAALTAFETWKRSHRAYVPGPIMTDTVPEPEETAAPTDIDDKTIAAAATTEETEDHHEDTSDIATSGQTAERTSFPYVRPALCAEGCGRATLGRGLDLRDEVNRHNLLALAL